MCTSRSRAPLVHRSFLLLFCSVFFVTASRATDVNAQDCITDPFFSSRAAPTKVLPFQLADRRGFLLFGF